MLSGCRLGFGAGCVEMRIDGRYRVEETLGNGAQAEVLRVFDPLAGTDRALKLARDRDLRRRFRRELQLLAAVRHPNIVRAFEYGEHEGRPFFTMERVEGHPLDACGLNPTLASILGLQILDGLACLHARGWVHRDIKPENVLVVGRGSASLVRLIDFGLAARGHRRSAAAGTLPYVAPEVARGEIVDGRADLYSLGVILYETLTGNEAKELSDVSKRYRQAPEIDLSDIPKDLAAVVTRLMAPEPDARFPTAVAAADALAAAAGLTRGPRRFAMERMVRGALSHRPAQVRRLLRRGRAIEKGGGDFVVLSGPSGVGKTAMMRELGTKLSLRGARVAYVAVTNERASPIAQLQRMVGASESLSDTVGLADELLRRLGERPTTLFIDDLQQADAAAYDVLREIARRVTEAPLLVVAAHVGSPSDLPGVAVIQVPPLNGAQVRLLVRQRLDGLELSPKASKEIADRSRGLVDRVERRLARMLTRCEIQQGPRGFALGVPNPDDFAETDVSHLVSELAGDLRTVLWAASVLGQRVDSQSVAHVAALDLEYAESSLAELVRLELLVPTQATRRAVYRFTQRELHSAVYRSIPPAQRRAFHDRAAEAVGQGRRRGARIEERVEHLLKGSDDSAAVAAAVEAGNRAEESFADRRAIEYFARAYAGLSGTQDSRSGSIALRLGRLFERTGELERALLWYRGAAADPERRIAVEAYLGLASIAWVQGDIPASSAAVDSADATLPSNAGDLALRIATMKGRIFLHRGEVDRASVILNDALERARDHRREQNPEAIGLHLELARLARKRGELLEAVRETRRASALAREHGDSAAIVEANMLRAEAFLRVGSLESASKSLFTGLEQVRRRGDRVREASIQRELGHVRFLGGDLRGALERYTQGLELAQAVEARPLESLLLHDVGRICALFGEFSEAFVTLRDSVAIAEHTGELRSIVKALLGLGRTQLEIGDRKGALDSLRRIEEEASVVGRLPMARCVSALEFELHARTGASGSVDLTALPEHRGERADALAAFARGLRGQDGFGSLVGKLGELVRSGGLEHLRAEWLLLHAELSGTVEDAEMAVTVAQDRGLALLEIRALFVLAAARDEGDARAESLTRSMERLRALAVRLSPPEQELLLRSDGATAVQGAFRAVRQRVLPLSAN